MHDDRPFFCSSLSLLHASADTSRPDACLPGRCKRCPQGTRWLPGARAARMIRDDRGMCHTRRSLAAFPHAGRHWERQREENLSRPAHCFLQSEHLSGCFIAQILPTPSVPHTPAPAERASSERKGVVL